MGEEGLSLGTFLFMLFNFAVLVAGLSYLLFKPIRKIIAERQTRVQDELAAAAREREEAAKTRREAEAILEEAREQAFALVEQARVEAEKLRQEKLAETKKELARLAERNRAELQYARERVVEEVRQEMVGLVMAVAEKVLAETMDPATHRRFIEHFLQGLAEREAKGERWRP
ncbi:MAG: F0F1 ATP synthase subunit B [Firmicutes bacterium]|nr:F0F1 ATP synthase subunit B [Bacillota bacterium]